MICDLASSFPALTQSWLNIFLCDERYRNPAVVICGWCAQLLHHIQTGIIGCLYKVPDINLILHCRIQHSIRQMGIMVIKQQEHWTVNPTIWYKDFGEPNIKDRLVHITCDNYYWVWLSFSIKFPQFLRLLVSESFILMT